MRICMEVQKVLIVIINCSPTKYKYFRNVQLIITLKHKFDEKSTLMDGVRQNIINNRQQISKLHQNMHDDQNKMFQTVQTPNKFHNEDADEHLICDLMLEAYILDTRPFRNYMPNLKFEK